MKIQKILFLYQTESWEALLTPFLLASFPKSNVISQSHTQFFMDDLAESAIEQGTAIVMECDSVNQEIVEAIQLIQNHFTISKFILINPSEIRNKSLLRNLSVDKILVNPPPQNVVEVLKSSKLDSMVTKSFSLQKKICQPGIERYLKKLCTNTNAYGTLLVRSDGYLLAKAGIENMYDIETISILIATNVAAAKELAACLGNKGEFTSNYHTGKEYNIYTYSAGEDYLLATVFGSHAKLGMIRFYTQQAVASVRPLLSDYADLMVKSFSTNNEQLYDKEATLHELTYFFQAT